MKYLKVLFAALLLGVAPQGVSAQIVWTEPATYVGLSKACYPENMLVGKDTVWMYVPCRDMRVLEPHFRAGVECTLARQKKGGWQPLVQETGRSNALQKRYYAKGRTLPGPRVTNARDAYLTVHAYGLAVDIISAVNGWEDQRFFRWQMIHAEACGLVSGGAWQRLPDFPHIQTGAWQGAPPQWAQEMLKRHQLDSIWRAVYP